MTSITNNNNNNNNNDVVITGQIWGEKAEIIHNG